MSVALLARTRQRPGATKDRSRLGNRFGEFGGEDLETRVIGYASGLCRTARRSFLVLWVSGGYVALMLHVTSMKGQMLNASLGTNKCVASAIGVSDGKKRFIDAARTTPSVRPRKEDAISRNNSCLLLLQRVHLPPVFGYCTTRAGQNVILSLREVYQ